METKQMQADPNSNRSKKRAAAEAHNAAMRAKAVEGSTTPTSEERAELERLSVKVFSKFNPFTGTFSPGPSSRWQTLLKRGTAELVTEEVTEYVPEEKNEAGEVIKAVEEDRPHLGLSLWLMSNPVEATDFIRKVKAGQVA